MLKRASAYVCAAVEAGFSCTKYSLLSERPNGLPCAMKKPASLPSVLLMSINVAIGTYVSQGGDVGAAYDQGTFMNPPSMSCKSGGNWTRPGDDVANTEDGVADCADICSGAGYTFFGLECPRSNAVHCQCANDLSDSTAVGASYCNTSAGAFAGSHCAGPYTAGNYHMGGHGYGSVYVIPKVAEYVSPSAMSCKSAGDYWKRSSLSVHLGTGVQIQHALPGSTMWPTAFQG